MEEISEQELFELAYGTFIFCLKALASSPAKACEQYGHFNVARELRFDVSAGIYLSTMAANRLSTEQSQRICALDAALTALPDDATIPTNIIEESLRNMSHSSWVPVRAAAVELLELLRPVTEEKERYLQALRASS